MSSLNLPHKLLPLFESLLGATTLECLKRGLTPVLQQRSLSKFEKSTLIYTLAYEFGRHSRYEYAAVCFDAYLSLYPATDQLLYDYEDAKFRSGYGVPNTSVLAELCRRYPTNPQIFALWANAVFSAAADVPQDFGQRLKVVLAAHPSDPTIWLTAFRLHEASLNGDIPALLSQYPEALNENETFLSELFSILIRAGLFSQAECISTRLFALNQDDCSRKCRDIKLDRLQEDEPAILSQLEKFQTCDDGPPCSTAHLLELVMAANAINLPTLALSLIDRACQSELILPPNQASQLQIQKALALWELNKRLDAIAVFENLLGTEGGNSNEIKYRLSHLYLSILQIKLGGEYYRYRFLIEKPVKRIGTVYGYPQYSPSEPLGNHVVLWGEQGIGEQLFFLKGIFEWVDSLSGLTILVDRKLLPLVRQILGDKHTVAAIGDSLQTDPMTRQLSFGDAFFWVNREGKAYDEAGVSKKIRQRICAKGADDEKSTVVGLSTYSRGASKKYGVRKCLPGKAIADEIKKTDNPVLCLDTREQAKSTCFDANSSESLVFIDDYDPYEQLLPLARTICCLNRVITVSNTNAHLSSFLGVDTTIFCAGGSARFWYWATETGCTQSYWYDRSRVIEVRN